MSTETNPRPLAGPSGEIVAAFVEHSLALNASQSAREWDSARPVTFDSDWQGSNPDPERETQVRVLWSPENLYLRFECRYRDLHLFADSDPNGRRDQLWDRDVAEAFLQPDPSRPQEYKEFEVSPNGMWIDLDIDLDNAPGRPSDLKSGMQRSVVLDEKGRTWTAELAIPMRALTRRFDPNSVWRVNFYRVEGKEEPRGYYAWQPTCTPHPSFHVPAAFGRMWFAQQSAK